MLTDPRLLRIQAVIGHVMQVTEDYNSPLTVGDHVGSTGKPSSRPPGEQQCPWLTDRVVDILERATASCYQAIDVSRPRERSGTIIHSIGGIELDEVPGRRGPYRRRR